MNDPRYISEQGREADIARTRHHFSAVVAGLKTAQEYVNDIRRELDETRADRDRLAAALTQIMAYRLCVDSQPYYTEAVKIAREALNPGDSDG